ncbi:hypothetical protein SJAG_00151 [Schizosaccharomyces japonicus yFS275]|uniref:Uncharacterized protein n=1 Tax=Schizosaccharomyces japonicus (strain yFS275 / FY16936) TaxID=402676 RepID=B6JXK9_SCHJY|nr:hypothetical protein SJAG_00151 [Schizosaccharomyces japonicus yFS275]EEB05153.1 hypothetical protein SJAG_00151 [Schizosaccharomyces japonicus yFS275]
MEAAADSAPSDAIKFSWTFHDLRSNVIGIVILCIGVAFNVIHIQKNVSEDEKKKYKGLRIGQYSVFFGPPGCIQWFPFRIVKDKNAPPTVTPKEVFVKLIGSFVLIQCSLATFNFAVFGIVSLAIMLSWKLFEYSSGLSQAPSSTDSQVESKKKR